MDNNGNPLTGDLASGGVVNGNLVVQGETSTDILSVTGKYTFPTNAPTGPNETMTSTGIGGEVIWSSDLSVGDVSSITNTSIDGELVLFNQLNGKSIKNSGILAGNILTNPNPDVELSVIITNDENNTESALLIFKKQRGILPVLAGDQLGKIQFDAYNGSGYSEKAHIRCRAVGDITGSDFGTQMYFTVTNEGGSLTSKLLIWDDGTQIFDNLISPNLYCGGDKGLSMYLEGDGDKIDFKDKNNVLRLTIDDNVTVSKRLILNEFGGVEFEDGGNGQFSTLNSAGEYTGYFGDTCQCYRSDNTVNGARITLSKTRGTQFIPLSMIDGDRQSEIISQGHVGGNVYRIGSRIETRCTENWSPGNAGSNMILATTNKGNIVPNPKLLLNDDGVTVTNNNFNVQGNLRSIVIQDTASGAGLCNGALSFHDINNAGVHTLSAPFGIMTFYHLGVPEFSISPTETISYNNTTSKGTLTIGDNIGGQQYTLPSTKGNDGEHLQLSGNDMVWAPDQNSGDVTGPNTSIQNEIVTYSGNSGKVIKNSDGYIEGGQITCFQGFESPLSLGYKLYNNNQVTYTVTGTALTDLIPNIVNSFFPVNNASFNWTGKKVRIVIRGTLLCANNAQMFINIGFLNNILSVQSTGSMSTANVSPGKKVTFTFEVDFRSNPNVIHFYEYRMDLSLLGGNTQYFKSIYLNNTIDQTVSTQPLFIRAYWDTSNINNQFLCRSTEVYII